MISDLHEISNPYFWENKNKYFKMNPLKSLLSMLSVNGEYASAVIRKAFSSH